MITNPNKSQEDYPFCSDLCFSCVVRFVTYAQTQLFTQWLIPWIQCLNSSDFKYRTETLFDKSRFDEWIRLIIDMAFHVFRKNSRLSVSCTTKRTNFWCTSCPVWMLNLWVFSKFVIIFHNSFKGRKHCL